MSEQANEARCKKYVKSGLQDRHLQLIIKAMKDLGCPISDEFFKCQRCPFSACGYFNPDHGVLICQNVKLPEPAVHDTMRHELLHAYDTCRAHVDMGNCLHRACTEIRAANLSGDCWWSREKMRKAPGNFTNHKPDCVRRRAELSLKSFPPCKEQAAQYVQKAWDICYNDYEPFAQPP